MALRKEDIERGSICPDWCPEEYFSTVGEPEYATPERRVDHTNRNFVNSAVLFYQQDFNTLYSGLYSKNPEENEAARRALVNALAEQEPGGRIIYQVLRRRQRIAISKASK